MTGTGKRAPEIRFRGFTDNWEQRKLGEVFFQTSKYVNPKESNLELWSLTVENGLTPKTERYNREFLVKKEDQFKSVDHNEFIYNPMNMTLGAVDLNLTGKTVAVSGYYITMLSKDGFDSKYFSIWLKSPLAIKMYKLYATGSLIERQRVQFPTLSQIKSSVPQIEEQTKIGSFFKQLDDTIALHQRKLTLLKQLKQTYLKQIFPQNKENMPALRFAGFSEPWKQSKFDEVFSHVQNNSLSRADLNYKSGYAMNIHYGDILIRFGEYLDVSKYQLPMIANKQLVEKYKSSILKDGDIVIADAAEDETVGKCSELGGIEDANILAGLHTIPSRPNWTFASGYLGYYMNSSAFHDQLLPLIQGTKISSISKSALKKTDIKYPHGKDEQTKIGNLFKQLDDSIALHQSKLEKLMDLKQVLLVKMFV